MLNKIRLSVRQFFVICIFHLLSVFADREPLLVYNQFPRIWDMNFEAMTAYVPTIARMGFNVVWVNPFFKTSELPVERVNEFTGEPLKVKGSLYAMYDPALTYGEIRESSGNPAEGSAVDAAIRSYTAVVKEHGMVPIFDLVLNHVAKDSPLVSGNFPWFRDNLKVNTRFWFKPGDERWDDTAFFDYDTPGNRESIFNHLWIPLITRAIKVWEFQGVRVDYGTDVDQEVLFNCIQLIETLGSSAIVVLGEALIPGSKPNKAEILAKCKPTGFTHLTNLSVFLTRRQIDEGKPMDMARGYQWFLNDLGLKKAVTTTKSPRFRPGTIGFAASHDHGTSLQSYMEKQMAHVKIEIPEDEIPVNVPDIGKWTKQKTKCIRGGLISQGLRGLDEPTKVKIVKEQMAIAAFASDAGWCFFASDEILSTITKSPFVCCDGRPFGGVEASAEAACLATDPNPEIVRFVGEINKTFRLIREAPDVFWVEMFYYDDNHLVFVRHLSSGQLPVDVVVVNLFGDELPPPDVVMGFLKDKLAGINWADEKALKIYLVR
ncbi:MAG: hypothetical protein LBR62_03420 [Puniceicoccales bacterium]|jgi:hypothetical protein|nr:hypothetical protein [Puniceicoccales bacterium]